MSSSQRVLWVHNFRPDREHAGIFMNVLAEGVAAEGGTVELRYIGNLRSPLAIVQSAIGLRRVSSAFDVVHAQFGSACGLLASLVKSKKVLSLRGSDWYRLREGPLLYRSHGLAARSMTLASIDRYDKVVVMSEHMRDLVCDHVDPARVSVIPDGIDLDRFRPIPQAVARAALGCSEDMTPWVLYPTIHETNPIKRPWLALQAVEYARRSLPDLALKVASNIPHGQMPLMINASSVVLMTSTHEGWPNSIKEALACNVPFVSTDVSDLSGISQQESSCSVEKSDPVALGDAIVRAVQLRRSETLRGHVLSMGHRVVARRLLDMYRTLS